MVKPLLAILVIFFLFKDNYTVIYKHKATISGNPPH